MPHAHEAIYRPATTLDSLPDTIFIEIFAFCIFSIPSDGSYSDRHSKAWQALVKVCKRWRHIIYGSPRYLDLHLHCSNIRKMPSKTSFRRDIGCWPDLPLNLDYTVYQDGDKDVDDLISALEQPDRVRSIAFRVASLDSRADEAFNMMKVPFLALRYLRLTGPELSHEGEDQGGVPLPRGFLGGSTPCLQHLCFEAVNATLFQELPKLLLSGRNLISLQLEEIPDCFDYTSPEAMAAALAGLTKLRALTIRFRFPEETPEPNEGLKHRICPEPPTRGVLPALTEFVFSGTSAYLEDIVAQLDMPSAKDIKIVYFPPGAEVHELSQFIGRTEHLCLAQFRHAEVNLDKFEAYNHIQLDHPQGGHLQEACFWLGVSMMDSYESPVFDDLVTHMTYILSQLTPLLSNVRHLSVKGRQGWFAPRNRLDDSNFIPLLRLFPAVEALHVYGVLAGHIATALENIDGERVIEVMPVLHSLKLSDGKGQVEPAERFLSLRRLSGHPVNTKFE